MNMWGILVLLIITASTAAFAPSARSYHASRMVLGAAKTTLTEETTWSLRLLLNGIPTEKGKKVSREGFHSCVALLIKLASLSLRLRWHLLNSHFPINMNHLVLYNRSTSCLSFKRNSWRMKVSRYGTR